MAWLVFKRDLWLAIRRGGGSFNALGFCLMAFALFAFGLGVDVLRDSATSVLVVIVLLSCVLALPNLFEPDEKDGTLEQYLLHAGALEWLVLAKLAAFWCSVALPLITFSPLLMLMTQQTAPDILHVMLSLTLGTPILVAVGSIGSTLTLNLHRGGLLPLLLTLPWMIPPLIFMAVGENIILLVILLAALPLGCFTNAALLRLMSE